MKTIKKIGIIGAGNLAWHLSFGLKDAGLEIVGVYNRSLPKAEKLAVKLKSKVVKEFKDFKNCDLILLLVSDDAIIKLSGKLNKLDAIIAHTSGNTSLEVLFPNNNMGVFYPLQSFSKDIKINLWEVPFLVEANNTETENALYKLAGKLSKKVYRITSQQRRRLHVAAVFANNFTNHMFKHAWDICKANDIPFEVLTPLIEETVRKINETSPANAQTGPAVRHDHKTIKIHEELLEGSSKELYKQITEDIMRSTEF